MKKLSSVLLALLCLFTFSCNDKDDEKDVDCYFISVYIELDVFYEDESPVLLDSFKVYLDKEDISDPIDFTSEYYKQMRKSGSYLLNNGTWKDEDIIPVDSKKNVLFVGYMDGEHILEHTLTVGADECNLLPPNEDQLKVILKIQTGTYEPLNGLAVNVRNKSGLPAMLGKYTLHLGETEIINSENLKSLVFKQMQTTGNYVLDMGERCWDKVFENSIKKAKFTGYVGDNIVVEEELNLLAPKCEIRAAYEKQLNLTMPDEEGYACTEDIQYISLKVTDKNNNPVSFDSLRVILDSEENITFYKNFKSEPFKSSSESGEYVILSDHVWEQLVGKVKKILVAGYINKKEVFKEIYQIGADQCHVVYLDDKPLTVILD